jgi:hypothetical protein
MGKYGKIIKTLGLCAVAHVAEDYKRGYAWHYGNFIGKRVAFQNRRAML